MTASQVHGGDLRRLAQAAQRTPEELIDFSASINPLGPPEWLRSVVASTIGDLVHYPDPDCTRLRKAAARRFGVECDEVLAGNGSTELLFALPRAIHPERAIIPAPSYSDYRLAFELAGMAVDTLPLRAENGFQLDLARLEATLRGGEVVVLGQPNNPTGKVACTAELRCLARRWPRTTFVVDEAFIDFTGDVESLTRDRPANTLVLRSLTKIYAIPGLRLGLAIGDPRLLDRIRRLIPSWSVNVLAQAVGEAALTDDGDYQNRTRTFVTEQREHLTRELGAMKGFTVFPGQANYLLVRGDRSGFSASALARRLLRDGVAIRTCGDFDALDDTYFRIAVRTEEENAALCRALRGAWGLDAPAAPRKKPAIMFQGTSSGAGKSLLTTALCRILLEDGYRVAPFKSQNMSLNSFVTHDGGEIGRAQALQAQACRLDPDVRMNPILLKPSSDTGAQVILRGRPVGNMSVEEYIRYKPLAFREALASYDELAAQHDVMVLEGAGSPAEVNLKRHDIVNMQVARHAGARVLIVGDIDRGGVFAALAGTMEALEEWERRLVSGFVVNRFRGRQALLGDALDWTRRATGRPVLGVVPFLSDLRLPEEDSLGLSRSDGEDRDRRADVVECVVVGLPHMSNFTDFDALRAEPDVRLRFARTPDELGEPDALLLPGSKNVFADMEMLRRSGLARVIAELTRSGRTEVVGICGGLQLLGARIADPEGLESAGGAIDGLGLLPTTTTLEATKILARVRGVHLSSGLPVHGYEIHHGRTAIGTAKPIVRRDDGEIIGVSVPDGAVWGTYLHGLFDDDAFRRWFVDGLRRRRGLSALSEIQVRHDIEPAIQRLADTVRSCIDVGHLYREVGLR